MSYENLNSNQSEAVSSTEGPLLVLAGAGTGKTKVLTSRIINIVNSHLASPMQILAVTFTNKAAAEMKHRMAQVIGDQVNNLWIGTFHSIAARILRRHPEVVGLRSDFTIIDDDDQTRLLKQILTDMNIDIKQFLPKNYLNKISRLKDKGVSTDANSLSNDDIYLPKIKDVYQTYQYRLKSMNAADFGDLLAYNLEIFAKSPDVLAYYQDKFKYILVDEYQDTNDCQYQWLLKLADKYKNICAVGDDDQSIYSWRGANVANILRFEKDFANSKVIRLEQNYRSTPNILKAASSVIANNKERHKKTLWTQKNDGEKVRVLAFNDDRSEAATIANAIKDFITRKRFQPSQIAILVRAGYQTRQFEEVFIQQSLPYKIIGGMKFYERLEIRDSIAYLRVCANPDDDLALGRIINVPKRGIGDAAISSIHDIAKQERITFFAAIKQALEKDLVKGKAATSLKFLVAQIEKFNKEIGESQLVQVARDILTQSGYISMWQSENSLEAQGRIENIEEFLNSLTDFDNITEFLEYASLVEARDDANKQDAVTVMTVHGAKGLEFDLVYIPGLEDGVFPSGRTLEEKNGLEEERRLMYVAITRAKKELVMSYAKSRYVFGNVQMQAPSRFLKELPQGDVVSEEISFGNWGGGSGGFSAPRAKQNFSSQAVAAAPVVKRQTEDSSVAQRVFHQKFGYGKVVGIDGSKLEIQFEKTGRKTVMKDFVTVA